MEKCTKRETFQKEPFEVTITQWWLEYAEGEASNSKGQESKSQSQEGNVGQEAKSNRCSCEAKIKVILTADIKIKSKYWATHQIEKEMG